MTISKLLSFFQKFITLSTVLCVVALQTGAQTLYEVGEGKTYATIADAIAAVPQDISGTGEHVISIGRLSGNPPWDYNEPIDLAGISNSSATDFVRVTVPETDRHYGVPGGGVRLTGAFDVFFIIKPNKYAVVEWIELADWSCTHNEHDCFGAFAKQVEIATFSHLLVHGAPSEKRAHGIGADGCDSMNISNCTMFNAQGMAFNGGRAWIRNSSIYNPGGTGVKFAWGDVSCQNVIAITPGDDSYRIQNSGTFFESSNNISSDESAPGPDSMVNQDAADYFVSIDASSMDLRLKSTSPAIGVGISCGGDYALDITGFTRPTDAWDIGAHQYNSNATFVDFFSSKLWYNTSVVPGLSTSNIQFDLQGRLVSQAHKSAKKLILYKPSLMQNYTKSLNFKY